MIRGMNAGTTLAYVKATGNATVQETKSHKLEIVRALIEEHSTPKEDPSTNQRYSVLGLQYQTII